MKKTTRNVLSLLWGATILAGCAQGAEGLLPPEHTRKIIDGPDERGYPAVGALIEKGFLGLNPQHKCTSVLIKPSWVLTAAHCLKGDPDLTFSVGFESKSGQQFEIDDTFSHPRYDDNPIGSLYDIALVKLQRPVPGNVAEPIAYNTRDLAPFVSEPTLYVGYGSTSGTSSFLGVGRKRRTSVPIDRVDQVTYSHAFDGTGVCFGDSGGPGLIEIEGELTVVGIVSAALGCQGGTCDPCTNGSKATRVDRFADWIAHTIGDAFASCEVEPDRCVCGEACADDGICDHAVCGTQSCGQLLDCLFVDCADSPDGSCSTTCLDDGTPSAREVLRPLVDCWGQNCRKVPGSANEQACVESNCAAQWEACEAHVNPEGTPEPITNPPGPTEPGDGSPADGGAAGGPNADASVTPPSVDPGAGADAGPVGGGSGGTTAGAVPLSGRTSEGGCSALGSSARSLPSALVAALASGLWAVRRRRRRI